MWYGSIIIFFLYVLVFALGEVFYKIGIRAEGTRKITHIGGGAVAFLMPYFVSWQETVFFGLFFSLFLIWTKRTGFVNSVHKIKEQSFGAELFPLSLGISAFLFWRLDPAIFQASTLVLGFSDGFAGWLGEKFGRKGFLGSRKSFLGSSIFFTTAFFTIFFSIFLKFGLGYSDLIYLTGIALVLTLIEIFSSAGWDNLFVTVASGGAVSLLLYLRGSLL
jgi:dolichol kinase